MRVFLGCVLSLICEAVLCLELVFAELGQAHYESNVLLFFIITTADVSDRYPIWTWRTRTSAFREADVVNGNVTSDKVAKTAKHLPFVFTGTHKDDSPLATNVVNVDLLAYPAPSLLPRLNPEEFPRVRLFSCTQQQHRSGCNGWCFWLFSGT